MSQDPPQQQCQLHAACVALPDGAAGWRGVLISGSSGSGKSELALALVNMGATLVADDRVDISRKGSTLLASAPDNLRGLIEIRHVGIMRIASVQTAKIAFLADLDCVPDGRLPPSYSRALLGLEMKLVPIAASTDANRRQSSINRFANAIFALLNGAELIDPDSISVPPQL